MTRGTGRGAGRLLVDTSVLIKWFHSEGETELAPSHAIRDAHRRGDIHAHILDLGLSEFGNVLVRGLRWPAPDVVAQLDDLVAIVGAPLAMARGWWGDAARLAEQHALSFYDASWAAAAAALRIPLVSADRRLVSTGLAVTPSVAANQLGIVD